MDQEAEDVSQLQVAIKDKTAFVRVHGRATFRTSSPLKKFGLLAMERDAQKMVLDMAECVSMDSTFMGVLAGLSSRFKKQGNGNICLVNLSPRTLNLLTTLGLDHIVETHLAGQNPPHGKSTSLPDDDWAPAANTGSASQRDTARLMLDAHQALVKLAPENAPRFKDVLAFLHDDVNKPDDKPPSLGDTQRL